MTGSGTNTATSARKMPRIKWSTAMFSMRRTASVTGRTHSEISSMGRISGASHHFGPIRCLM